MGKHFRAGEWGQYPRCGSVITGVFQERSLYARVHMFLRVKDDPCPGYACVSWFGYPEYPDPTKPLVVGVTEYAPAELTRLGSVVKITAIDPSQVMIEPTPTPHKYFMMRDSGFDTLPEE